MNNKPFVSYYRKALVEAFDEYRKACYGDRSLSATQLREVRQAFLSGIHWRNTYGDDEVTHMTDALALELNIAGKG